MTFAEPPRILDRRHIEACHYVAEPGPGPDGDDLWHAYVPGADVPPCGGRYHEPRRTPIPLARALSEGKPLCRAPECFPG